MPTGYTANLIDGKETPEEFMLKSLRGMGVAIMQRDESLDAPIQRRVVEDYYVKAVAKSEAELESVLNRSDADWKKLYRTTIKEISAAKSKAQVKYELESRRIQKARELINSKTFPAELAGWKEFMLDQLKISEPYEPGEWYDVPPFGEWKEKTIDAAKRSLEYSQESLTRQQEIVKGNNEWLDKAEKILERKLG